MTAVALNFAAQITIVLRTLRSGTWMPRLWNKLIDDAIEVLLNGHVIVSVKDNIHTRINQHLVNWFRPIWSIRLELILSGHSFAAPFPERCGLGSASVIAIAAAHQMMNEYEPQLCSALFRRMLQPLILMVAQRPVQLSPSPPRFSKERTFRCGTRSTVWRRLVV